MASNLRDLDPEVYVLNRLFTFPTDNGPQLAVAVTARNSDRIISFYSLLVKSAVVQLWTIMVVIGVYFSLRQPNRSHNSVVASAGVLNAKRPLDVTELSIEYLWKLKRKTPGSLFLWLSISTMALVVSSGVPILVGPYIVAGHGAPVNPIKLYVPDNSDTSTEGVLKVNSLEIPAALRAVGGVQSANISDSQHQVRIDDPEYLEDLGDGESISRYHYSYNVTAKDFGLQHYHGLELQVQGSCVTEYNWWFSKTPDEEVPVEEEAPVDTYHLWNDETRDVEISIYDAPMPIARFIVKEIPREENHQLNTSFAILVSSSSRKSFTRGDDPFYLTDIEPLEGDKFLRVLPGRPVLSCWQSDSWVYKDQRFPVSNLNRPGGALADIPEPLNLVLTRFLSRPKIESLGIQLGASALLSATTGGIGEYFDASRASVHSDLSRLVLASYIATKNTLSETAFVANGSSASAADVPNLIPLDQLDQIADFVLYSGNVRALSVSALASIPLAWAAMFLIAWIITSRSWFPWYYVQGLQATLLYSFLDEKFAHQEASRNKDPEKSGTSTVEQEIPPNNQHSWKRDTTIAWFKGDANARACIVPRIDGKKSIVLETHEVNTESHAVATGGRTTDVSSPSKEHGSFLDILPG
ncbi:hypothetical protein BDV95DRAFT_614799 [Massariosphaeria phaeospora]|uniref:Uncharacterized protein n=1 Tax=Massariosphaeria phaeospora TaxID=100035 RepID=A0A7C8MXX0_9PLEO|nr:hypothetical protein BDV95DRAFT_614799 [Massariosphaeria phaeospora]